MEGFFIGLFVGGFFGVAVMSCLNVASAADDQMKDDNNPKPGINESAEIVNARVNEGNKSDE